MNSLALNLVAGVIVAGFVTMTILAIVWAIRTFTAPSFGEQLDNLLTRNMPQPKRPHEYLRDGQAIPIPPSADELQAIAEAHRKAKASATPVAQADPLNDMAAILEKIAPKKS